ncbi:M23 family metallopeptidase [Streptomyces sp. NP160]|uniref:M23 family metallopeptidase n=1 Tax=Streptomyces sp. NP160 TaxID=2586637 RepID=UPI00111BA1C5|nr:M23 family metallopeptidase [Streptomyces sp. NP160]TNM62450.1 M23 family metallopeptidase [Streptomyces sp. NP160]
MPVLVVVLLLAVAAAVLPAAPAAAATSPPPAGRSWWWPLHDDDGPPAVLRRASLPQRPWQPGHRGVDLAAAPGQDVLAPVAGVVVAAGAVAGRPVLSIRAASGWRATLEPVDASVAVGDRVVLGQRVGALAATASHCGAASCLHWGVRTGSGAQTRYRDPLALLRPRVRLLPVPGWGAAAAGGGPVSRPRPAWRASPPRPWCASGTPATPSPRAPCRSPTA